MPFHATRQALWISGIVTLLLTIIMVVVFAPLGERGGLEIVSLQFSFTPDRFFKIVERWGEEGVALFRSRMWLDYLYPTAYSFLLAGSVFRKTGSRTLILIPFTAGLFDFIENSIHLNLLSYSNVLSQLPRSAPLFILLASLLASAKWLCILAALFLLVFSKRSPKSRIFST